MKKLNRKGFTLIELLAIIVILAIIMVVTIPTVLSSMNTARKNQLQNATDSVAEWFTKQYELANMGDIAGGADTAFNTFIGSGNSYTSINGVGNKKTLTTAVLEAAGIANAANNIDVTNDASYVYYNTTNNKICVQLTAKSGGSFYVNDGTTGANVTTSSGCPTT